MADITQVSTLNQGQEEAADAFFAWLFTNEKEMGIDGPGGVGKTHLMAHLIDVVMPRYFEVCELTGVKPQYDDVVMTAMTNKAAEVLSTATGRPVSTIQSFMNLKVTDDYDTGVSRLSKTGAFKVHERKIIFIDEASMFEGQLDNFVQEGTIGCKIVYVGDDCQLRAVGGANPIYEPGRMKWVTLTQQMRTQVPAIQALHDQLRYTVKTGTFYPIQIVPGLIDHLDDDQMQAGLASTFAGQTLESRILAYTNRRVMDFNDYLREVRQLPHEYTLGELLVNNGAIRLKGSMLRVEEEVEITNIGQDQTVTIGDADMIVQHMDLRTRSGAVHTGVPVPSDRNHHVNLVAHFRKLGRSTKNWGPYYDLKNRFPDLRPRDAATVYKAQGSTYDTAYVDLGDISKCHNPDQVARQLYVALSRERHRIFLFGELADKYGGLHR
jgi:hypothetical protein